MTRSDEVVILVFMYKKRIDFCRYIDIRFNFSFIIDLLDNVGKFI